MLSIILDNFLYFLSSIIDKKFPCAKFPYALSYIKLQGGAQFPTGCIASKRRRRQSMTR